MDVNQEVATNLSGQAVIVTGGALFGPDGTWELSGGKRVFLSDTVGFIRGLPHNLVASFHATLQEARDADLLLHVVDAGTDGPDDARGIRDPP